MKNIYLAFIRAKAAFGPALKDKNNPAFRSKYADLGACIDAVEVALLQQEIAFIQETSEDLTGVTVETVFLHSSGESLRCGKLHVPAAKQDPQGYGSALTYARRYSLMTACGIAPEDDDGNAATKAVQTAAKPRTGVAQDVLATTPYLPTEERESLQELAEEVKDAFKHAGAPEAFALIQAANLEAEQKIYLSTLLPSNVRNPITAHSRSVNSQKVPA